jgi:hypothetical protein
MRNWKHLPGIHHARLWWHVWRHQWHLDHFTPQYAWIAQDMAREIDAIRRKEA